MKVQLTAIDSILTEEAEERLRQQDEKDSLDYEGLGIAPPQEEYTEITESDYKDVYSKCEVETDDIVVMVDNIDKGSTLYLNHGIRVTVKESIDEINSKSKNFFQLLFGL